MEARGRAWLLADDNADMRDYVRRLLARTLRRHRRAGRPGGAWLPSAPDAARPGAVRRDDAGARRLRAAGRDPRRARAARLPVILLSARAGEEARSEGLDAGADDYLTKPFSARELLARVGANLAMARVRREAIGGGSAERRTAAPAVRAGARLHVHAERPGSRLRAGERRLHPADRRARPDRQDGARGRAGGRRPGLSRTAG